jgi:Predicted nucleotidyltransferases
MAIENPSIDEIRNTARPILEEHSVAKAEIFGSYARNEENSESDIDIIVELEDGKTLADMAKLKKELEKELHRDIDILTYDSVHPKIREKIFSEAVEI